MFIPISHHFVNDMGILLYIYTNSTSKWAGKEKFQMCIIFKKIIKARFSLILFAILLVYLSERKVLKENSATILGSVLIVMWGWHKEKEKDREFKVREYLTNAYTKIAMGVQRIPTPSNFTPVELKEKNIKLQKDLEEAIAIIQLYGTENEIKLVHEIILNTPNFDSLLNLLRQRLRKELNLRKTNKDIKSYRLIVEKDAIKAYIEQQIEKSKHCALPNRT